MENLRSLFEFQFLTCVEVDESLLASAEFFDTVSLFVIVATM